MANLVISGNTSGSVTLSAPDVSGSTVLTLPTTTGTLVVTGGAQTVQFAAGTVSAPSITTTGDSNTGIFFPTADTIAFTEGGVESMRIDSSGNVGIGSSSITAIGTGIPTVELKGTSGSFTARSGGISLVTQDGTTNKSYIYADTDLYIQNTTATNTRFYTNNAERMRITSGGDVGIGTTAPIKPLSVEITSARSATTDNEAIRVSYGTNSGVQQTVAIGFATGVSNTYPAAKIELLEFDAVDNRGSLLFYTRNDNADSAPTERMRITSDGTVLIGTTSAGFTDAGIEFYASGAAQMTRSDGVVLAINRLTSDGNLVEFYQASTLEGTISVSGNTVSYNAFAGSHWSQLSDGSKPEILRGTVMESINELCEWPDEPTSERLCRVKISDTASSKKVYGVFMCWDEDWTATNDMLVTSVGAFICRINKDVVVEEGDLLESNGDGTARVQADDVMRSSTIGKVTCTVKTHEYDDGSYCVPTVLYCG